MEETDYKKFVNTVISLSKLFSYLKDGFLVEKLYKNLIDLIIGFIKFSAGKSMKGYSEQDIYVAQCTASKELLSEINSLLELSEYLEHYNAINASPLLLAQRNLLFVKLDLIKFTNKIKLIKPEASAGQCEVAPDNLTIISPANIYSENDEKRLSVNKEKIIHFIKRFPRTRTKDIIEEFSVLSERTVKRNLKELLNDGFIKKTSKDNAVYYTTI